MQPDVFNAIRVNLTNNGPMIVLCVLGIIFALVQREKAPKAATFVIISLVVLVLMMIVRPFVYYAIVKIGGDFRMSLSSIWGFVCTAIDLASTAGLIFAVFYDRTTPTSGGNPYAKDFASFPANPGPTFPGPAPLPPLGRSPPQQ